MCVCVRVAQTRQQWANSRQYLLKNAWNVVLFNMVSSPSKRLAFSGRNSSRPRRSSQSASQDIYKWIAFCQVVIKQIWLTLNKFGLSIAVKSMNHWMWQSNQYHVVMFADLKRFLEREREKRGYWKRMLRYIIFKNFGIILKNIFLKDHQQSNRKKFKKRFNIMRFFGNHRHCNDS